jgi:hypothetical protein
MDFIISETYFEAIRQVKYPNISLLGYKATGSRAMNTFSLRYEADLDVFP